MAYIRLTFTVAWVLLSFTYRMIGFLFIPFSREIDERFRKSAFIVCAKGLLLFTGVRVTVKGTPPSSPFYLVSNHFSFIDIFVLASQLGCVFVSKAELGNWPLLGFISRNMSTIFIDRAAMRDTHRVYREISDVMRRGRGVVIFPEGGVSQDGTLLPFKPALLQSAIELDMPVHVATIHYVTPNAPERAREAVLWEDDIGIVQHFLNIAGLGGCECTLTFSDATVRAGDRKQLALDLYESTQEIYTAM